MGIGNRILYYMQKNDMQQKELAKKINMSPVVLNRIVKNRRPVRGDELSAIATVFGVTLDTLVGNAPILPSYIYPLNEPHRVPVIGSVRCGTGGFAYEYIEEYISIDDRYRPDEIRAFRAEGDSMSGDEIHEGDICLVHLQEDVPNGAIAVVVICDGEDGEGTLKRIHKESDGTIILNASNPKYPPRVFSGEDVSNVRIIGRVVEVRHRKF